MSRMFVDNIVEKTSANGVHIPGHVLQVQYNSVGNTGFSTTSSTDVAVTGFNVNITPKFSNSLIVFSTEIHGRPSADANAYIRFSIVDSLNNNTQWNSGTFAASEGYLQTGWITTPINHTNVAGTTNAMRLQLMVRVTGGGTYDISWSGGDIRTVQAMEIAQ